MLIRVLLTGQAVVIVPKTDEPCARLCLGKGTAQGLYQSFVGGAAAQRHQIQRGCQLGDMAMGVDKAGQHATALQVYGSISLKKNLVIAADGQDAAVFHQNGLGAAPAFHGENSSVVIRCFHWFTLLAVPVWFILSISPKMENTT